MTPPKYAPLGDELSINAFALQMGVKAKHQTFSGRNADEAVTKLYQAILRWYEQQAGRPANKEKVK